MRDLPVRKIPGFGRVTERCLEGLGVEVSGPTFSNGALTADMRRYLDEKSRTACHESLVRVPGALVSRTTMIAS